MSTPSYVERRRIARDIRVHTPGIAETVTAEFFKRHPDWLERYGSAGVTRGIEDARFHLDFLAGAIETGSVDAFVDYAKWTARVLAARGMQSHFLVENLRRIAAALNSVAGASEGSVAQAYVDAAVSALRAPVPAIADPEDARLSVYISAALAGQRQAALNIVHEMLNEDATVVDVYCNLLQPAQYEIGRRWQENLITVAHEHMASAVTQYVVAQLYAELPAPETLRGNAVVTGVQGELHQLGANMVSDMWESNGWNVRFLGTQLPHSGIIDIVREHRADVLGISTTMLFNLDKVAQLIVDVRAAVDYEICVIVGGRAFEHAPTLWSEIGADAFGTDLVHSINVVNGCSFLSRI